MPPLVVAMGDPQAPFATMLQVLDAHQLLDSNGQLRSGVHLVSLGDHFDYGPPAQRAAATDDALRLLRWLAGHDAEQCTILFGNHDLARVGELASFDDESYRAARAEADLAYSNGALVSAAAEQVLLQKVPFVPSAEVLARDFSAFCVEQRELVTALLRTRRARLAFAHAGLLCVHAGVTVDALEAIDVDATTAEMTAAGLNAFLDARVAAWSGGPIDLAPLHVHGSAREGEALGALCHRPAEPPQGQSRPGRRYDPRRLPTGFPQAIGHIRDEKCRALMPTWADGAAPADGLLRSLVVEPARITYRQGCVANARLYFCDGAMSHTHPSRYELFDVQHRAPVKKPSRR